ncbi:MAG: hypothetical protein JSR77_01020 [Planctomycetes bacterium]|nr:hypothetical protein [Planctomycetota bacterium]
MSNAKPTVSEPVPTKQRRAVYAPLAITVVGACAAVFLLNPASGLIAAANAQPVPTRTTIETDDPSGRVSAAEQRKEIIAQLRSLNSRMEKIESMMSRGLSVKVTDMPPMRLPKEAK